MYSKRDKNTEKTKSKLLTRGDFLARAGGTILASIATAGSCLGRQSTNTQQYKWKGRKDSNIKRWDVITIGNLSRNRYWGESDARSVRSAICTCTLITGKDIRVLVDPSLPDKVDMIRELDRRSGTEPRDITDVFITHQHGDHLAGITHFPDAKWLAAPSVAKIINKSGKLPRIVESATDRFVNSVDVIHTPGHTNTHHSLRFDCDGLSIVVAGDSVATRDFYRERRGYFNAVDFELSARTMEKLTSIADIIIPGHDNYFLVECVT